jgi:5-methylcytosine-specific restriction endonuclease McrA
MPDDGVLIKHQPDHIIAVKHGGQTTLENLAYACYACNHQKGSDIAPLIRKRALSQSCIIPETTDGLTIFAGMGR